MREGLFEFVRLYVATDLVLDGVRDTLRERVLDRDILFALLRERLDVTVEVKENLGEELKEYLGIKVLVREVLGLKPELYDGCTELVTEGLVEPLCELLDVEVNEELGVIVP